MANEPQTNSTNAGNNSKEALVRVVIGIILFIVFAFFGSQLFSGTLGVSVKNVDKKSMTVSNNSVYFETKCPECGHISQTYSVNISKGESYDGYDICSKCNNVFDVSIKR